MLKMDEKAVGASLPKYSFFQQGRTKNQAAQRCFIDLASTILSGQWYKDKKDNFNGEKWELLLLQI